tara:strand:+ start:268 stop:774 length:507 start_codon:yes stop_codon:yes gene_type:complete
MIIQCENCNKKFEIQDNLIPDDGRLLECGSCAHQWHYTPITKLELTDEVQTKVDEVQVKTDEVQIKDEPAEQLIVKKTKKKSKIIEKIDENDADNEIDHTNENITTKKKNISFINFLLVGIISFVAIVILFDTFKNQIAYVIPNISLYINELHEILRDIFLFIADLSK